MACRRPGMRTGISCDDNHEFGIPSSRSYSVAYVMFSVELFSCPNLILSLETCIGSFCSSDISRSSLIILEREILTLKF